MIPPRCLVMMRSGMDRGTHPSPSKRVVCLMQIAFESTLQFSGLEKMFVLFRFPWLNEFYLIFLLPGRNLIFPP